MATIETCHFLMRRILIEYHDNYWVTVLRNDITEVRGVGTHFFALIICNKMAALLHVNCGTIPCQLWHYSMSTVALLHVSCGTIPCQLWHYSMSTVALFHVNCGTIPCQVYHSYPYVKQIECFLKTFRHFRGLCDIKMLTVQSFVYIPDHLLLSLHHYKCMIKLQWNSALHGHP